MADDQRLPMKTGPLRPEPARFTPEEFDLLVESGVAEKLGRFELRGGELYRMNAQYSPHMRMKVVLTFALKTAVEKSGCGLEIGIEGTIRFGDFMPLPDVFLLTAYPARGPIPGDSVRLVIEVAASTVADDLGPKRDLYAAAGLREYWVVDMVAGVILQHADPVDGVFTQAKAAPRGETARSLTLPGLAIETADLPWDVA